MSVGFLRDALSQSVAQVKDLFSKSLAATSAPVGSLGVDIGTHSVKVVRLEIAKEGPKILGFAVEKIVDKNFRDALSKALLKSKSALEQGAVVSVAGQGVVSRYIELPMMNRSELESSMRFEIEKYVPFSLAEVASDYAVIEEKRDKAKMLILIAAAKNDIIGKKCHLAQEVNLNLKAVDLDCLALANFFTEICGGQKKGACLGIINIGKTVANIDILVEGMPYLSRDIFVGGDDITAKMTEALELDYAGAEKLKADPGPRQEELMAIWDPVLNSLAAEIRVSLDYFEARNNRSVEKIFITGGSSRLAGIREYLNHLLGVEVKNLDCSAHLRFDGSVDTDDFGKNSDLLAVALGLALR